MLPFVTTWMDLVGIMLSEISQADFAYMCNLKNKINKQNRNKLIDTENILMVTKRGEGLGKR